MVGVLWVNIPWTNCFAWWLLTVRAGCPSMMVLCFCKYAGEYFSFGHEEVNRGKGTTQRVSAPGGMPRTFVKHLTRKNTCLMLHLFCKCTAMSNTIFQNKPTKQTTTKNPPSLALLKHTNEKPQILEISLVMGTAVLLHACMWPHCNIAATFLIFHTLSHYIVLSTTPSPSSLFILY